MSLFLKLFNTTAEYNAYTADTANFILPNVSCTLDGSDVHYNPLVKVTSVSLNKNELSLSEGNSETLVATVLPSNASNKNVTWSSSDDTVATVSSNGLVTAVATGNTNIIVTTVDGGLTAQCDTTVTSSTPSHDFVEIGGVKWATMNVGASSVTDYGNYYQYGKGSAQYAATSGESSYSGTEDPLAASADTATQEWGGDWHMPTKAQFESLTANTNYTWETDYQGSGINGGLFTDKTDSSKVLFFPAAGRWSNGSHGNVGSGGRYWSSTPSTSVNAYYLSFSSGSNSVSDSNRLYGYSVRPVMDA